MMVVVVQLSQAASVTKSMNSLGFVMAGGCDLVTLCVSVSVRAGDCMHTRCSGGDGRHGLLTRGHGLVVGGCMCSMMTRGPCFCFTRLLVSACMLRVRFGEALVCMRLLHMVEVPLRFLVQDASGIGIGVCFVAAFVSRCVCLFDIN